LGFARTSSPARGRCLLSTQRGASLFFLRRRSHKEAPPPAFFVPFYLSFWGFLTSLIPLSILTRLFRRNPCVDCLPPEEGLPPGGGPHEVTAPPRRLRRHSHSTGLDFAHRLRGSAHWGLAWGLVWGLVWAAPRKRNQMAEQLRWPLRGRLRWPLRGRLRSSWARTPFSVCFTYLKFLCYLYMFSLSSPLVGKTFNGGFSCARKMGPLGEVSAARVKWAP
jgi:hypothetical protein